MPSERLAPDFLCIGAQKAGTTWLYAALAQHEGVFLPPIKEIHFFDYIHIPSHRRWVEKAFARNARALKAKVPFRRYIRRLRRLDRQQDSWYAAVFEHRTAQDKLRGEITPAYSILPPEGIEHVRAVSPEVRILFIIRDPVDRALSQLRMAAGRRGWKAVNASIADREGFWSAVLARSAYRENIHRWEAVIDPGRILYLPYGMIRHDPAGFMRRVEDFLGLGGFDYRRLDARVHKSKDVPVSPEAVARIRQDLAEEQAFLRQKLGPDFVA